MNRRNRDQVETGSLTLHLLDSAEGHPVQTWQLRDRTRVRIGRAAENDISLVDTRVSRLHVELFFGDGKWQLRSHGRNGTQIDGNLVSESRLTDQTIFQLGANGPSFQFVTVNDSVDTMATIDNVDPAALDFLAIDEKRREEEVQTVAESETFQQLQEQARRLRESNGSNLSAGDS